MTAFYTSCFSDVLHVVRRVSRQEQHPILAETRYTVSDDKVLVAAVITCLRVSAISQCKTA